MTVRVLLVDDQPLVRAGLQRIFELTPEVDVVGECRDGDEVGDAVEEHRPDVVLMDVRMKRMDGAEATRLLTERPEAPPVLVLTTFDDDETVAAALSAGASGFILKDAPGEDLVAAVLRIASGDAWLDPGITPGVLMQLRRHTLPRAAEAAEIEELTDRELDVLRLVGRGRSNREIGEELHISEATVKTHVGSIFSKLHLRDRAAAIVFAFDHGLVAPED